MTIEGPDALVGPSQFPGRQGRHAFAFLVCERLRPVSREEMVEVLWGRDPPRAWDSALSAIVSKLRMVLSRAGLDGSVALVGAGGCYELRLPNSLWVDVEEAADSIHEAETALRAGDPQKAYGPSAVAHHIARRPFLPGQEGHWVEARRAKLHSILVRALECRAEVYLWNGEQALATEAARDVVRLRPFRESGYRLLMRAHAAGGNAAEALQVYEECRTLIARELGAAPSSETKGLHREILRG